MQHPPPKNRSRVGILFLAVVATAPACGRCTGEVPPAPDPPAAAASASGTATQAQAEIEGDAGMVVRSRSGDVTIKGVPTIIDPRRQRERRHR